MLSRFLLIYVTLTLLLVTAIHAQEKPDETIHIETSLVSVPVIVSDRQGRYVTGLRQEDFTLYEDKIKQPIAFFAATEEPFNVALILDTSRSTQNSLDDIRHAAKDFLKQLRAQDRALIVTADVSVRVLCGLTSDRRALEKAVERAEVGEQVGTLLRDALHQTLDREFKQLRGRKAIIVLTDGLDHGSRIDEDDLLDEVAEADTLIYPIFYAPQFARGRMESPRRDRGGWGGNRPNRRGGIFNPLPFPDNRRFPRRLVPQRDRRGQIEQRAARGLNFLEELAERSAGRLYRSEATNLNKTFALIADELRQQYRLGFYPGGNTQSGTWHTLGVEVARPDMVVRARKGYRN